jgi:hypothetical protein
LEDDFKQFAGVVLQDGEEHLLGLFSDLHGKILSGKNSYIVKSIYWCCRCQPKNELVDARGGVQAPSKECRGGVKSLDA